VRRRIAIALTSVAFTIPLALAVPVTLSNVGHTEPYA
jgi:hypothetical protein